MSTDLLLDSPLPEGAPELTSLGKRLEILRIERGISTQHLARFAGTSRQQLWRVMTGKSELTDALRQRLAQALEVETSALVATAASASVMTSPSPQPGQPRSSLPTLGISLETYLTAPALTER